MQSPFKFSKAIDVVISQFQADVDNSGTIDYGEFIAATVHLNKLEREEHLIADSHERIFDDFYCEEINLRTICLLCHFRSPFR